VGETVGKVVIIPARPEFDRMSRERSSDPRYVDGQRLLVDAMMYLVKADPEGNRPAVELLSEHVRTQFRMSDRPAGALSAE
jgi:hypothetical protein